MKVCTKCKVEKDESCFGKGKHDGTLHPWCKQCHSTLTKAWRKKNKLKFYATIANWKKNNIKFVEYRRNYQRNFHDKNKFNSQYLDHRHLSSKKCRDECRDVYLKKGLKDQGFAEEQRENPDILEVKKLIIKIKRHAKQKRTSCKPSASKI